MKPLHFAIQYDDELEIVKLLLSPPKILNRKNEQKMTSLEWAKHLGKTEAVVH